MNVLLINPRVSYNRSPPSTPLGIISIGTYLKERDFSVRILDRPVDRRKIQKCLDDFDPDAIGISVTSSCSLPDAVAITRYFHTKNLPVIWGAHMASLIPEVCILEGGADYIVLREGEETFFELLKKLSENEPIGDLPGIVYQLRDGSIHKTPDRPFADLKTFSALDFSLVNPKLYWQHYPHSNNGVFLYRSKGCPGNCTFCFNPFFHLSQHRQRSDDAVCADIRELVTKYGVDGIYFGDECFFTTTDDLLSFCQKMKDLSLPFVWGCQSRIGMKREDFQAMYDAGCRWIFFGVESGSRDMLKTVQKGQNPQTVIETFRQCHGIGIQTLSGVILGLPGETDRQLKETVDLMFQINASLYPITFFSPIPETPLWDECVAAGAMKVPASLDEWAHLYMAESGKQVFGNTPRKEIMVIRQFFYWASFVRPSTQRDGFLFLLRRAVVDRVRVFARHGFSEGVLHLFSSAFAALSMIWYISVHPKIRKKYGLYLKNFTCFKG